MRTSGGVVAFYPSPAGATESEIDASVFDELCERNPRVKELDVDSEVLIVDRLTEGMRSAIAPTDQAYKLVGLVKVNWQGISGGPALAGAVDGFFEELREKAK
jgi:hypothetical protein